MRVQPAFNFTVLILALALVGLATSTQANAGRYSRRGAHRSMASVPTGTTVQVSLGSDLSTDDVHANDTWLGTTTQDIYLNNSIAIPAGSGVSGQVTTARQGTHSTPPQLGLAIRSVSANGRSYAMNADTPTITGGTQRAKKLGAIAGGAAVGALLGHAAAKDSHGTLIGGIAGGAAGYGLTRNALRTLQLKQGTTLTFTTRQEMAFRR